MGSVAVVTGARSAQKMGLEFAEARLLDALRRQDGEIAVDVRVVGRRGARDYAERIGGRWYPSISGRRSRRAFRGADLVHLAGLSLPPPRGQPFVATFHDLSPFHFDDEGMFPAWGRDVAARAELLICPSHFTAGELEAVLHVAPERIRVVPNGPGMDVSPKTLPLSDEDLARSGLSRPFALRLGGWTARKNVRFLFEAWTQVEARSPLMLGLVGPPHVSRDSQLAEFPLRRVRTLDYVPPATLPRLLRAASLLVTTSTYEGFGLPALEAMAAGVPVVAFRTPFVEEVCDGAALFADDADAFASEVERVVGDKALRDALSDRGIERAREFSWEAAARDLLGTYWEVIGAA